MVSGIWFGALAANLLGVEFVFPLWAHLIGAFSTFLMGVVLLASRSKLIDAKPSATSPSVGAEVFQLILTGISVALYYAGALVLMDAIGFLEPRGQRFKPENVDPHLALMAAAAVALGIAIYFAGSILISAYEVRRQDRLVETMTPRELEKLRNDLTINRRGTRKSGEP